MCRSRLFWEAQDYERYLERYEWVGEGLPRLEAEEFFQLQDEFLSLQADQAAGGTLSPGQRRRMRELRRLLLADF
jgi:hypothetical protein